MIKYINFDSVMFYMQLFVAFSTTVIIVLASTHYLTKRKCIEVANKHFIVTGGSSGIGKSIAVLLAQKGAHVTIVARNRDKLQSASREIQSNCNSVEQKVSSISVDVSDYDAFKTALEQAEISTGPVFGLINCAGLAICGKIEDIGLDAIRQMVDVNFLGSLYPTKLLVPKLKERKEGLIVFTSSQVALMGMFGYSVYSACKFALRGLAESIDMEVRPYNVYVTLALPADTDTPGYENENRTKPLETMIISSTGGLFKPEQVARQILSDALKGRFFSYLGFESFILTTLCIGMAPFASFIEVLYQALLMGPLRIISACYIKSFHEIITKCMTQRNMGNN